MLLKRIFKVIFKAKDKLSILSSFLKTILSFNKEKLIDFIEDCEASIEINEIPGLKDKAWEDYHKYAGKEGGTRWLL